MLQHVDLHELDPQQLRGLAAPARVSLDPAPGGGRVPGVQVDVAAAEEVRSGAGRGTPAATSAAIASSARARASSTWSAASRASAAELGARWSTPCRGRRARGPPGPAAGRGAAARPAGPGRSATRAPKICAVSSSQVTPVHCSRRILGGAVDDLAGRPGTGPRGTRRTRPRGSPCRGRGGGRSAAPAPRRPRSAAPCGGGRAGPGRPSGPPPRPAPGRPAAARPPAAPAAGSAPGSSAPRIHVDDADQAHGDRPRRCRPARAPPAGSGRRPARGSPRPRHRSSARLISSAAAAPAAACRAAACRPAPAGASKDRQPLVDVAADQELIRRRGAAARAPRSAPAPAAAAR